MSVLSTLAWIAWLLAGIYMIYAAYRLVQLLKSPGTLLRSVLGPKIPLSAPIKPDFTYKGQEDPLQEPKTKQSNKKRHENEQAKPKK